MTNLRPTALLAITFATLALVSCQSVTTVRVLAYNIHHGAGLDEKLDLPRIAGVIRASDPDVVALQEIDVGTTRTGAVDQAQRLGGLTGMHHAFGPFMPYRGGEYGMAILSRHEILEVRNIRLPPGTEPRTTLAVRVRLPGGTELTVAGIHFYRTQDERLAQAKATIDALADEPGPVILAGDFNSQPGGPVLARVAEDYDEVPKTGDPNTFPADGPEREIDHFYIRPLARFVDAKAVVLGEEVASDHRPILLEARLR